MVSPLSSTRHAMSGIASSELCGGVDRTLSETSRTIAV
jgi:hypothetical protein